MHKHTHTHTAECITTLHHDPWELECVHAHTCARGCMICHTVRGGCLNNVCCLKGCSVFPLDYKMAGSGSCCENQLLLQTHISVQDHVGLWRPYCLQSSVSNTAHFAFYPRWFSVVDHVLSSSQFGLIDSAELQCFCSALHSVNTNPAPVTLQHLSPPVVPHCTIKNKARTAKESLNWLKYHF